MHCCKSGFISVHRLDTGKCSFIQASQIQTVESDADGKAVIVLAATTRLVTETYEQVVCALKKLKAA